jgi:hypothetical protein
MQRCFCSQAPAKRENRPFLPSLAWLVQKRGALRTVQRRKTAVRYLCSLPIDFSHSMDEMERATNHVALALTGASMAPHRREPITPCKTGNSTTVTLMHFLLYARYTDTTIIIIINVLKHTCISSMFTCYTTEKIHVKTSIHSNFIKNFEKNNSINKKKYAFEPNTFPPLNEY